VINILADQRIQPGEHVLTAGGDQIFPRGLAVGVVERVAKDPERGSFINVIVKPAANLQHLDEVLVITSLDAHLSSQQQADLATSEELKGAEAAADAARKKAAEEMEERLPGLKDPNAPAAAATTPTKIGPDGKPVPAPPVPPATPKPLPALHPDRFSPGAGGGAGSGSDAVTGADASDSSTDDSGTEKPAAPKPQPKSAPAKPNGSQPASKPAPKTPQLSGRVQ